jgi:hypothetical protein
MTTLIGTKQSATGDYDVGDNVKILLGASDDLQIYHDGTNNHSYIKESGTGDLRIEAQKVGILSADGLSTMAEFNPNAEVALRYDNSIKLATTSSGISVTGSVDVAATTLPKLTIRSTDSSGASLKLQRVNENDAYTDFELKNVGGSFRIVADNTSQNEFTVLLLEALQSKFFTNNQERMLITSTGNVGIGTTNPTALLDLTVGQAKTATSGANFITLGKTNEASNYAALMCEVQGGASQADRRWIFQTVEQGVANAGSIIFQKDGGNVGIGVSSPEQTLVVAHDSSATSKNSIFRSNETTSSSRAGGGFASTGSPTATNRHAQLWLDADGANFGGTDYFYIDKLGSSGATRLVQQSASSLSLATSGTDRMTITSTGNVGIGTDNPVLPLVLQSSGSATQMGISNTGSGEAGLYFDASNGDFSGSDYAWIAQSNTLNLMISTGLLSDGDIIFSANDNERMRITSTGTVSTTTGSAISYAIGSAYNIHTDSAEVIRQDNSSDGETWLTMKTFVAVKSGKLRFRWEGKIWSGTYYWAGRFYNNGILMKKSDNSTDAIHHFSTSLASGFTDSVHSYRTFQMDLGDVSPGDVITYRMASATGSGSIQSGNGQNLYCKNFEAYSTTPTIETHSGLSASQSYAVDFLVVAGGGGGGHSNDGHNGGGGGAGGYRASYNSESSGGGGSSLNALTMNSGTQYTITVGSNGVLGGTNGDRGTSGGDSTISGSDITNITSTGGGGGGCGQNSTSNKQGLNGGSGGGSGSSDASALSGGTGQSLQGFAGGTGAYGTGSGGSGGGAGAVGTQNGGNTLQVDGGVGVASTITGSSVIRAYGGPIGGTNQAGRSHGGANTGEGGRGGYNSTGWHGGSGVVILRMPTSSYSSTITGSPTVTTSGSDTILTFNGSGTYTG